MIPPSVSGVVRWEALQRETMEAVPTEGGGAGGEEADMVPDPRGGLHHQEHVHGIAEGPPEGGAEEQLDPHLHRTAERGASTLPASAALGPPGKQQQHARRVNNRTSSTRWRRLWRTPCCSIF